MSSNFKIRLFVRGGKIAKISPIETQIWSPEWKKHPLAAKTASAKSLLVSNKLWECYFSFTCCFSYRVETELLSGLWCSRSTVKASSSDLINVWSAVISSPSCMSSSFHFRSLSHNCHSPRWGWKRATFDETQPSAHFFSPRLFCARAVRAKRHVKTVDLGVEWDLAAHPVVVSISQTQHRPPPSVLHRCAPAFLSAPVIRVIRTVCAWVLGIVSPLV